MQVLSLIAELEARLDFDEDLPDMDAQRLQSQVRGSIHRLFVHNVASKVCMCVHTALAEYANQWNFHACFLAHGTEVLYSRGIRRSHICCARTALCEIILLTHAVSQLPWAGT